MSVREVQHGLSSTLRRVQAGDEVTITHRGKPVARLVPLVPEPSAPSSKLWDRVAQRLRDFPCGIPAGKPLSELIDDEREGRL